MEEQFTRVENDAVTSRGRRSLLKGAAWSVPAVAVAAAAPMAAASTTTPTCPTCIQPGVLGATTAQAVVLGNAAPSSSRAVSGSTPRTAASRCSSPRTRPS